MQENENVVLYRLQEQLDLIDDELAEQEAYSLMYSLDQPKKETGL